MIKPRHDTCIMRACLPCVDLLRRLCCSRACSHQPVWADADQYFAEQEAEDEFRALEEANAAAAKRKQIQPQQQQQETGGGVDPMEHLEAAAAGGS